MEGLTIAKWIVFIGIRVYDSMLILAFTVDTGLHCRMYQLILLMPVGLIAGREGRRQDMDGF